MWIKYKHNLLPDRRWVWQYLGEISRKNAEINIRNFIPNEYEEGVDYELILIAPKDIILDHLLDAHKQACYWEEQEDLYTSLLKNHK